MKKNIMYYVTIILTILFILVNTYSYAAEITKESLAKFFEDFVKGSEEEGSIEVTDTEIIIDSEGEEYKIQYDLSSKPKFTEDIVFKNGMTYDECTEEASKTYSTLFGFMAVAGINGADAGEALAYGMVTIMEKVFEQINAGEAFKEETFINAIDYAERNYAKDVIVEDDLFTINIKKAELAELKGEEYIVETELIVNTEKDFSVLNGKADEIGNKLIDTMLGGLSNSLGSITNQIVVSTNTSTNNTTKPTTAPTPLPTSSIANIETMPNAGFEVNTLNILKVVLGLSLVGVIVYSIYNKRYSSK